jgi:hypothetical protein
MRLAGDLQAPGATEGHLQLNLHIACPNSEAKAVQARGNKLARTMQVVGLAEVPDVVRQMFAGKVQGRTVIDVNA